MVHLGAVVGVAVALGVAVGPTVAVVPLSAAPLFGALTLPDELEEFAVFPVLGPFPLAKFSIAPHNEHTIHTAMSEPQPTPTLPNVGSRVNQELKLLRAEPSLLDRPPVFGGVGGHPGGGGEPPYCTLGSC